MFACIGVIARGCMIVRSCAYLKHGSSPPSTSLRLRPMDSRRGRRWPRGSHVRPRAFFADQAAGDAGRMGRFHLKFHAVRHLLAAQIQPGAGADAPRPQPFQVFPLRDVLGGTRADPAE